MDVPFERRLLFKRLNANVLALSLSAVVHSGYAQDSDPDADETSGTEAEASASDDAPVQPSLEELVVVGARLSLETARDIKRESANIVDSVTAVDVGALPDKSVAEALQRLPGITVSRFAASNDTQHFSAEPSGVVIRGLDHVRSEFNSRDTFSADSSRGLSWEDVSPELMSRVDVYKNQSANLIEGGIAGVVDLHTRVPFDFDGEMLVGSAEVNYSEVADSFDPNVSGLYSNRWETALGDFGLLGQVATSRLDTRSEGIYLGRMGIHEPGYFEETLPDGTVRPTQEETYVPTFITARDNLYERERTGGAFAAQWQSPDEEIVTTFQFNRSEYEQVNTEYSALNFLFALWGQPADHVIPADWPDGTYPMPGETFMFREDRSFLAGEPTAGPGWWGGSEEEAAAFGVNEEGIPLMNPTGCGWGTSQEYLEEYCEEPYDQRAVGMETNSRQIHSESMTQDASINIKWAPTHQFRANFDLQYVDATRDSYGTAGALQSYTGMYADFRGDLPFIEYRDPLNVNFSEGGLQNPNSWNYAWVQDHKSASEGESLAFKVDGEYDLNGTDWVESIAFGARTVNREQLVREAWNFRGITSRWESAAYFNADKTDPIDSVTYAGQETFFGGYPDPDDSLTYRAFPTDYMGGGVMDSTEFLYIDPEVLGDPNKVNEYFDRRNLGIGQFYPICSAEGPTRGQEILDANGDSTCFTPGETLTVEEEVHAAYFMVNYGGPAATLFNTDIGVSGNVGVRYVETNTRSEGSVNYGSFTDSQLECYELTEGNQDNPDAPNSAPPSTPYSSGCYLIGAEAHNEQVPDMPDTVDDGNGNIIDNPAKVYLPEHIEGSREDLAFHDGTIAPVVGDKTHYHLLPSANLKLDVTENVIVRFAYSKAMARPDFSMFRYAANINEPGIDVGYSAQCKTYNQETDTVESVPNCTPSPELSYDDQGRLTGARPRYSVNTGNPYLEPITADNYDATFEYYFEGAGMFTVNLFQKDFDNYITYGTTVVPVTNNGVTRDMYINGPVNGEGASVWGYEANVQRFLDFLPSPWDGIGFQANYTKIYNQGIENTNYDGAGGAVDADAERYVKTDALQGMSEDAYNLVLMYEKGDFAFRTAYNWRSEYLVTANDCCNLPVWQSDQGFLDASIRYRLTDGLEVSLQASNILDTTTNLLQQVRGSDHEDYPNHKVPTAWFKSDRRLSLGLRMRY